MGYLQREAQNSELTDDWAVMNFPGFREPGYEASVSWVGTSEPPSALDQLENRFSDPRDIGDALWPYRKTVDDYKADKRNPRKYYSMHQGDPQPPGGSVIKEEWLDQTWSDHEELPLSGEWVQSWDLRAGGTGDDSSYAVGQLWVKPRDKECVYLVDQVRGQWSINETLEQIQTMATNPLWKQASAKLIEKKADGRAVIPMLKDQVGGIIGVTPDGSKKARLESVSPYFAGGNVYLPEDTEWVEMFAHELKAFPGARHDDQVDTTSQALRYLFGLLDDDNSDDNPWDTLL
jgi:predicted phage terminase large subunit-like protein